MNSEVPDSIRFAFPLIPPCLALKTKFGDYVLNNLKKIWYLSLCAFLVTFVFVSAGVAQDRTRVVKAISSQPINQPPATTADKTKPLTSSRPILTNEPIVVAPPVIAQPLVKKTSMMSAASTSIAAGRLTYTSSISLQIMRGIESRLGIPYRYGSSGPNRYDCSGFVWSVFGGAGINFERSSARTLWAMSVPVAGDDRFKFGTLVFMNGLGHMGIVADENGFYHSSSSKGVTYSPFKGYWEKRIVGFRRLATAVPVPASPIPLKEIPQEVETGN